MGMIALLRFLRCTSVRNLVAFRLKYVNARTSLMTAPSTNMPILISRNKLPNLYSSIDLYL